MKRTIWSPHFTFLSCVGRYSNMELLSNLGIRCKRVLTIPESNNRLGPVDTLNSTLGHSVFITHDSKWIQIADNWYFDLYHRPAFRESAERMASTCDVFICWASDVDDAFEYIYFSGGIKLRHFRQDDYYGYNTNVAVNFGNIFECENNVKKLSQDTDWYGHNLILTFAESLGIDLRHDQLTFEAFEIETGNAG